MFARPFKHVPTETLAKSYARMYVEWEHLVLIRCLNLAAKLRKDMDIVAKELDYRDKTP